ncbi:MAG: hypothetical protein ACO1RX_22535 [Candidatus Sericytochromatia bacterium]
MEIIIRLENEQEIERFKDLFIALQNQQPALNIQLMSPAAMPSQPAADFQSALQDMVGIWHDLAPDRDAASLQQAWRAESWKRS